MAIGLLCVGAALDFSTARRWLRPVGRTSLVKFLVMPLATLAACDAFGLRGAAAGAALLFQSLPTASSSYIMARQLGGDAMIAGIIASQTVLAGLTLPAVMLAHAAVAVSIARHTLITAAKRIQNCPSLDICASSGSSQALDRPSDRSIRGNTVISAPRDAADAPC